MPRGMYSRENVKRATNWTPDRIEQLRTLWAEGKSAAQIQRLMPWTTRSGVIGKAHRLGLPSRPNPIKRRSTMDWAAPAKKQVAKVVEKISPKPAPAVVLTPKSMPKEISPKPAKLLTLEQVQKRNGCRYPFGHTPNMRFCGKSKREGSSYCQSHHAACTQPAHMFRERG